MTIISYLSDIRFDFGAIAALGETVAGLGVRRPLVVSDPGVAAAGIVDRALNALDSPGSAALFLDTPSNPTEAAALAALKLYRAEGCDGVVTLGGGSPTDLGKAVALLATHPGDLRTYTLGFGDPARIGTIAPLIAVPTAAGTGAEVGRAASLTLVSGEKTACVSLALIPKAVLCDPDLTLSLPAVETAATGMDALSHGIEAFLSSTENPPAEALALDCAKRAARWIERATHEPRNREARWEMMMAALEGGLALQKGLGAVHAASHPLGALGHHHGTLNAILLPPVLRFNRALAPAKFARLEAALGLDAATPIDAWCEGLRARLGLRGRLAALGVDRAVLPGIADQAAGEHLNQTNPRPLTPAEFLILLEEAM